jgi:hypothetical protein
MSALHLVKAKGHGHQCSGSQTVANSGAQRIAWQWVAISPDPHPSIAFSVNTSSQASGLPADHSPGVTPGGADVVNVGMKCTGQTYTIILLDNFGRTQQVTMTSDG